MKLSKKLFYIFLPIVLGSIIGFIISGNIDYPYLNKPVLSPPKWLFPVMWSIIYLLLGYSYYLYKRDSNNNRIIDIIYYVSLFFNLMWSIIFFNLKFRLFSIIWIIILLIMIVALEYLFYKSNRKSFYLNILYVLWIMFATYLNIMIYVLN